MAVVWADLVAARNTSSGQLAAERECNSKQVALIQGELIRVLRLRIVTPANYQPQYELGSPFEPLRLTL